MSASPAQAPSGPNSVTPTTGGPPAPMMRKKPPVNIFNTGKKKPIKRPPGQRPVVPGQTNGARQNASQQQSNHPSNSSFNGPTNPAPPTTDDNDYTDYPIVISKRALNAAGQRFHALKLHSRKDKNGKLIEVSPFDESQFVKPLRLHRRYARDKMEAAEQSDAAGGMDDKEREAMSARRAERQAEREENQKLIAPTGGDSHRPMKRKQQKKVEEGRDDSNPVRQKRQKLRYEEARPWHLEDFEGKNVWVGSYEEALSERSIMMQPDVNVFRMVPVEKWYRFIETNKVKSMDPEEAEKIMQKKVGVGRWGLNTQKANEEQRREEHIARAKALRAKREEDDDRRAFGGDEGDFQADRDMLDMEFKDEFQDDDEGMLFQGDEGEDEREIEQKIWLEMRNAGLGGTGVKDEDLDPEEEERRKAEEERKEKDKTKQLRKQLMKKEHQIQYGSDDEDFDSDDSDEEEQRKKEEQEKEEAAKKAGQVNGDKSGSSTRGTNTPSGRPEKRPGSTLGKRPGSPDVSDLSGNESSRKKIKSVNGSATAAGRALSPDMAKNKVRSGGGSGSGSDTDTSRGRKIKVKNSPPGSPSSNTPNGSRSGTPAGGSRAQSPKSNGGAKSFPTLEEVRAAIPPDGIEIKTLVGQFKSQVAGRSTEFIALVKAAGIQNKANGRIMQKT
ncbi:hypothetical protein PRZ48_013302 [Zasmidium cellare]|uniref:Transcription initiation factor IIF subunit alpha n=1 Tax=Zasmidium cellare TaxID=395010 RepID=A0ABR0E4K4_ZASCE|nr:hypothetical protein PRZ48_013302 [Zasmidium cellare]